MVILYEPKNSSFFAFIIIKDRFAGASQALARCETPSVWAATIPAALKFDPGGT
jgi:hypothetical protein